ncbi:MAG: hypothetical protein JWM21_2110 [Acidobacteria bacterium]|nr:hypothetical protein [Acidobacteriota bacterium]
MKAFSIKAITVVAICLFLATASAFAQRRPEPLTNASVIKLVRAGFKEKTIIAIIHSRANTFELNADRLIELKHNGVTENTILAMLSQGGADVLGADDLSDDVFFKNSTTPAGDNDDAQKDQSTSIFGSGGSSQSESHGRGMSGANQGNTQTAGSATVRILRPPVEEGGAPVKLERTPTLNNESVMQLVEAGFSEGTIVKRIEKSPVEFDLSPAKLTELRKHRVTEPVIAAMSAAMGESPIPKTATPEKSREN